MSGLEGLATALMFLIVVFAVAMLAWILYALGVVICVVELKRRRRHDG